MWLPQDLNLARALGVSTIRASGGGGGDSGGNSAGSGGGGGEAQAEALRTALQVERNVRLVHGSIVDRKLVCPTSLSSALAVAKLFRNQKRPGRHGSLGGRWLS